jgi:hypothetical protein
MPAGGVGQIYEIRTARPRERSVNRVNMLIYIAILITGTVIASFPSTEAVDVRRGH